MQDQIYRDNLILHYVEVVECALSGAKKQIA